MQHVNLLYIRPHRQELIYGWIFFLAALPLIPWVRPLGWAVYCAAALLIFRRFLAEHLRELPGRVGKLLLRSLLWFGICTVCTVLLNDLFFFFFTKFYHFTVTGPKFLNPCNLILAGNLQKQYFLTSAGYLLLLPLGAEVFFRGLVFGSIYPKSKAGAYLLSTFLFMLVHVLPFLGTAEPVYLILTALQYLPMGMFLGWAYAGSDSLLTPILIHMLMNFITVQAMR